MCKLSFIVPIYNVERYLRKCVDSLIAQDVSSSEYEVILVDDGSPDACPQICDEYAAACEDIRVIHRENGGLSAARNSGIEIAKGKYVCFVDSDDYWEPNVLGGLMAQINQDNLDVLRFNYRNVHEDGLAFNPYKVNKPYFDYSSTVVNGEGFLNERLGFACYAWQFILKRELLNNCLFAEGIYFEDTDWTPRMLLRAKRVASTELIAYNYLWREGSITLPDNPAKKKKVLEDKIKLLHGFQERRMLVQDRSWFIWQIAGTAMSILDLLASYSASQRRPYLSQLKDMHLFPLTTYRADKKNRIKIRMANISPSMYCQLMHLLYK